MSKKQRIRMDIVIGGAIIATMLGTTISAIAIQQESNSNQQPSSKDQEVVTTMITTETTMTTAVPEESEKESVTTTVPKETKKETVTTTSPIVEEKEVTTTTTTATTTVTTAPTTTTTITTTVPEETWDGPVLNQYNGVVEGPSGSETYYNLDMSGCINIMQDLGYTTYTYWVRSDGVKMFGDYVMCAANLDIRPKGTIVESTLGKAIVVDTGSFVSIDPYRLDIAVTW